MDVAATIPWPACLRQAATAPSMVDAAPSGTASTRVASGRTTKPMYDGVVLGLEFVPVFVTIVRSYRTNATSTVFFGNASRTSFKPTFACATSARVEAL